MWFTGYLSRVNPTSHPNSSFNRLHPTSQKNKHSMILDGMLEISSVNWKLTWYTESFLIPSVVLLSILFYIFVSLAKRALVSQPFFHQLIRYWHFGRAPCVSFWHVSYTHWRQAGTHKGLSEQKCKGIRNSIRPVSWTVAWRFFQHEGVLRGVGVRVECRVSYKNIDMRPPGIRMQTHSISDIQYQL